MHLIDWKKPANSLAVAVILLYAQAAQTDTPQEQHIGNWTYNVSIDAMTDARTFVIWANSDAGFETAFVDCDPASTKLSVFLEIGHFLGEGERTFTYRVDKRPAVSLQAKYVKKMAVLADGDAQKFLEELRLGKSLLTQFLAYDNEPWGGAIDIRGFGKALDAMTRDCRAMPQKSSKK